MRAQGALTLPRLCECCHPFGQLAKEIPLLALLTRTVLRFRRHVALLASSSALSIALRSRRCLAVKSTIPAIIRKLRIYANYVYVERGAMMDETRITDK